MAYERIALARQATQAGEKSQLMRLLDVFVFGPLMIAAGATQEKRYFRMALTVVGIGTIIYNGANYLQTAKKERDQELEQLGLGQRIAPDPRRPYRMP